MWQNNKLNKRINEELPHDFSLCDLDGVVHCFYEGGIRLIIYESKNKGERISETQLRLLNIMNNAVDWSVFDYHSGIFFIRALDDNFNKMEILDLELNVLCEYDINDLHSWFSCKDK